MQHQTEPQHLTNEEPAYNRVAITGTVTELTNGKTGDRRFVLSVNRLSGMDDKIPVSVPIEQSGGLCDGRIVMVKGMFVSHNEIVGDRSKLILMVHATDILEATDEDQFNPNNIDLVGFVCKQPIYRTTPFNREITDLLVAVNRSANKSDYIPAIAWGKNARYAKNLLVGEKVQINGRVQSREYQKRFPDDTVEIRTAYEVSINAIERLD